MHTQIKDNLQFEGTKLRTPALVLGIMGLLLSLLSLSDKHQFFFGYLTNVLFFTSISLGCLFFVLIQFLTRAGWSVVVRRVAEQLMVLLPVLFVFFLPIFLGIHELYHWSHAEEVARDHLLQVKAPYLNVFWFCVRAMVYWAVWIFFSVYYFKNSTDQDTTANTAITIKLQRISAVGILLFALSLTFASFDWIMSLNPHWYSTIFGVYFFAGSVVSALCVISLICLLLRKLGYLSQTITVEHYHDLGKLIYGFNIFWTYIGFSQYFLIWYANIPEETMWYLDRWQGDWKCVSLILFFGHFVIPFIVFMSHHVKRNLVAHACVALWLLAMHWVDIFWMVVPNGGHEKIHIGWVEPASLLGIGGILLFLLLGKLKKNSLVPKGDPRLVESLNFENY